MCEVFVFFVNVFFVDLEMFFVWVSYCCYDVCFKYVVMCGIDVVGMLMIFEVGCDCFFENCFVFGCVGDILEG